MKFFESVIKKLPFFYRFYEKSTVETASGDLDSSVIRVFAVDKYQTDSSVKESPSKPVSKFID